MYAPTVTLVAELPDRSTLPVSTVGGQGDQAFCFVVENGKLARTLLRVGLRDAAAVEVLKKATSPKPGEEPRWEDVTGNEAIVQGQLSGLTDGQPVDVK
jgi:hypothetical protein